VPPSSLEVEKVKGDLTQLSDLYKVSSFIVTSITTSPGKFSLNVQLVDAATRKVTWGRQFEAARENYNELARQAAEGIRLAVKPAGSPVRANPASSEVELALLEGEHFDNRWSSFADNKHESDFDAAMAAYTRALKADPSSSEAVSRIASLYVGKLEINGDPAAAREGEVWTRRALEMDPRCGRAWVILAFLEMHKVKPDIENQLQYSLRAAIWAPRRGGSHMAISNSVFGPGSLSLSLAAARQGMEVDPLGMPLSGNVILFLSALGRPAEALVVSDRAIRADPDSWVGLTRGYALLKSGRLREARESLSRWEARFLEKPDTFVSQFWGEVRFQVAAAERDAATLEKLEPTILPPLLEGRADALMLQNGLLFVSPALARLGRTDESIRILERSVEVNTPPPYDFLLVEADFEPLRGDPRFAKVLAASRDGAAKIAKILYEARSRGELPQYLERPLDELLKLLNETKAKA